MRTLSGQHETDFVNAFLDDAIPVYRDTLRAVCHASISPEKALGTLEAAIEKGLNDLQTDSSNAVGISLAYEVGLSLRNELASGTPCRLDRPRTEMMRTSLNENALAINDKDNPLIRMVSIALISLVVTNRRDSVAKCPEVIGAKLLESYIQSTGVFDNDDFPE